MEASPAHDPGAMSGRRRSERGAILALVALSWQAALAAAQAPAVPADGPATFHEVVEELTSRPEFAHSTFGIALRDVSTDEMLYERNADELFTPASTTKLLTEGTALALLGADHRFRTRIYRTGPVDEEGTLHGDLVLVASGDPNLSNRIRPDGTLAFTDHDHAYGGSPDTEAVDGDPLAVVRDLASRVADGGIRRVGGHVIVDASLFPEGEPEQGSGVVISPLAINDNVVDVTVGPGSGPGDAVTLRVSPATGYVRFVNRATTGEPGSEPSIRWATDEARADGSRLVTVEGSFPADADPILYAYAVPVPSRFGEVVLAEALQERGIVAAPPPLDRDVDLEAVAQAYDDERLVAEHLSPPLAEEVKVTLKVSQNLHASMTPYLLGALLGPDSVPPIAAGFDLEREFLGGAGLDLSGASQGDGAGGDRADFFTPRFMVAFLDHMAGREDFERFHDALPILGRDGTLKKIQPESDAAGHVHAKTGTYVLWNRLNRSWMLTSKALAGYVTRPDGRRLAFALYVNRMPSDLSPSEAAERAGQALGEIAAAAYALPVGPPVGGASGR